MRQFQPAPYASLHSSHGEPLTKGSRGGVNNKNLDPCPKLFLHPPQPLDQTINQTRDDRGLVRPNRQAGVVRKQRRSNSAITHDKHHQQYQEPRGLRSFYSVGDRLRHSSHVIVEPTPDQATRAVNSLKKRDYAFVKRRDGSYYYAMVAARSVRPTGARKSRRYSAAEDNDEERDEYMQFVMDEMGSTKTIHRRHWCDFVRLVATDVEELF